MEISLSDKLASLLTKIELLAQQRDDALMQAEILREENAALKEELKATEEKLHNSTLDAKFLTLSHKLADNPQSLADARKMVSKMLGRVEKAIALLQDDPQI